jgi:membrane peptidoglycan carboxypeptidase
MGKIFGFLGVSALSGVLVAGLLIPGAAAAGTGATASIDFFEQLPAELELGALSQPSEVLARDGSLIATIYAENREPVPLTEVSQTMQDAILAIEDSRFYEHGGVDLQGITSAVVGYARSGTLRGASTVTQQYVNNVLIDSSLRSGETDNLTISGTKDMGDKLREAKLAIAVEKKLSKEEILAGYLNIVPFSGTTFGIEAAAKYFFGIPASQLNIPQSALLAGLVNGPSLYSPTGNPELALERRNVVLAAMLRTGSITQEEHDAAAATDLGLNLTPVLNGCVAAGSSAYFCDYVQNLILADPAFGETREDRQKLLYRGGLTIKTTLDPRLQSAAQEAINATADVDTSAPEVGHSMVTVEPGTGKILVMAQNTNYNPTQAHGNTTVNYNVDQYFNGDPSKPLSGAGGFQPGSTYKAFTLAAWLDAGKPLNARVDGTVRSYPAGTQWQASCIPGGTLTQGTPYGFQNYNNENYRPDTVLNGITNSLNTITFASAKQLDLCRIHGLANDIGVHQGKWGVPGANGEPTEEMVDPTILANLLGATDVAPLAMASSFAAFAANGKYCAPNALTEVTDFTGKSYPVPGVSCEQAIKPEVAQGVNMGLESVMERGSGWQLGIGAPAAGKTGTNDFRSQTWFVGYTTGLATATWLGNHVSGVEPLDGKQIGGRTHDEIDGSLIAGPSWQRYMQKVVGLYPAAEFQDPPASMVNGGSNNNNNNNQAPSQSNNGNNSGRGNSGNNSGGNN